jgi:hypothetical protein
MQSVLDAVLQVRTERQQSAEQRDQHGLDRQCNVQ